MLQSPTVLFCGLMLVVGGQIVMPPASRADGLVSSSNLQFIAQTPADLATFSVGDRLEIERSGAWRPGQVVNVEQIGAGEVIYDIRYLDVGVVETKVSGDRLRSSSPAGLIRQAPASPPNLVNVASFAVGDRLEIERSGAWRPGQVVSVQQISAGEVTYDIRYLDVGAVEANVSGDRLRSLTSVDRMTDVSTNAELATNVEVVPDAELASNAEMVPDVEVTPDAELASSVEMVPDVEVTPDAELASSVEIATNNVEVDAKIPLTQQLGKIVYVERSGEWQEARLIKYRPSSSGYRYSVKYRQDQYIEENVVPQRIQSLHEARNKGLPVRNMDLSNPAAIQEIVDAHNAWRLPLGLQPLQWSDELAAISLEWAEQLAAAQVMEHSYRPGYGENLAEGFNTFFSPAQVVNLWGDEVADYDYETNTCVPGKMCGHYTQVVWDTTTEVGCATIRKDNNWEIWVCTYTPPGNYSGMRPY